MCIAKNLRIHYHQVKPVFEEMPKEIVNREVIKSIAANQGILGNNSHPMILGDF